MKIAHVSTRNPRFGRANQPTRTAATPPNPPAMNDFIESAVSLAAAFAFEDAIFDSSALWEKTSVFGSSPWHGASPPRSAHHFHRSSYGGEKARCRTGTGRNTTKKLNRRGTSMAFGTRYGFAHHRREDT